MVVRFAIEPDALADVSYSSPRDMIGHHKRLIKLWEQYGLLVDPGEGPDSITSRFGNQAIQAVRMLWQEAWKAKSRCRRVRPAKDNHIRWLNLNSPTDVAAYEHIIELALVDTVRGIAYLGIPDEDNDDHGRNVFSTYCGEVEAAFFRYPEQSQAFGYLDELSRKTVIPAGQGRSAIWSAWFEKLARRSKEVAIVDRYGFSRRGFNGICWALQFLNECMVGGVVTIYASNPLSLVGSSVPEAELISRIRAVLIRKPSSLRSVTIFQVVDQEMTKDRYIRFDECAFSVGHGVSEAFRGEYLDQDMPCLLDPQPKGLVRTVRKEVQRLVGQSHRKLRFENGSCIAAEDVVL